MFPFLIAGGAALGAGMSALSASSNNRAVKQAAAANIAAANNELVQKRFQTYDQMGTLTQNVQSNIGKFLNSSHFGSSGSINAVLAQMYTDAYGDNQALRSDLSNAETSNKLQRQGIVANASNQMQSVGLSVLQGGIQGAMTGAALGSAIDSFNTQNAMSKVLNDPNAPQWKIDAALKGVAPTLLNNPRVASILSASYTMNQQIQNTALQAAQAQQRAAQSGFNFYNTKNGGY
jgi:hypothetical protein